MPWSSINILSYERSNRNSSINVERRTRSNSNVEGNGMITSRRSNRISPSSKNISRPTIKDWWKSISISARPSRISINDKPSSTRNTSETTINVGNRSNRPFSPNNNKWKNAFNCGIPIEQISLVDSSLSLLHLSLSLYRSIRIDSIEDEDQWRSTGDISSSQSNFTRTFRSQDTTDARERIEWLAQTVNSELFIPSSPPRRMTSKPINEDDMPIALSLSLFACLFISCVVSFVSSLRRDVIVYLFLPRFFSDTMNSIEHWINWMLSSNPFELFNRPLTMSNSSLNSVK